MRHSSRISLRIGMLLAILFVARVGQVVHIHTENPLHFEAFCRDLAPRADDSDGGFSERCLVDDFYFFPFLECAPLPHLFRTTLLARVPHEATRSKAAVELLLLSLRAPPLRS